MSFNHVLKYPDGSLKTEMTITDGRPDGPCNNYWPSGNLQYAAVYADGVLHGVMTEYTEDGSVKRVHAYEMGELTHIDGEAFSAPSEEV